MGGQKCQLKYNNHIADVVNNGGTIAIVGIDMDNKDLKPTCQRRNRPTMKCRAKCCRKKKIEQKPSGDQEKLWLIGTPKQQLRNWRNRQN